MYTVQSFGGEIKGNRTLGRLLYRFWWGNLRATGHLEDYGTGFWWANLRATGHLEVLSRRREDNITTDIQEMRWRMDWIDLAQYKDRWLALVNVAVNFRVA